MAKQPVSWLVLADGSRALFMEKRANAADYIVVAEHRVTDAGAAQQKIDPQKAAFAREVAAQLNEASGRGAFDALILYAAPGSLAVLRETLDAPTRKKLKAAVAKDRTKAPLAKLRRHLAKLP